MRFNMFVRETKFSTSFPYENSQNQTSYVIAFHIIMLWRTKLTFFSKETEDLERHLNTKHFTYRETPMIQGFITTIAYV